MLGQSENITMFQLLGRLNIENIENMNLVVDFENIVKKRSIFSMFKKQKHVKSGTYNDSFAV